jgi:hypothetical protein
MESMTELAADSFEAYESGAEHKIKTNVEGSAQGDLAVRFYKVTDFFHAEGVDNAMRFAKLAKVCLDAQKVVEPMYWDSMMAGLYYCFANQTRQGFSFNTPEVEGEFSSILLDASLHHENQSLTKILCGQGRSRMWWASREAFTPQILKALLEREDKAEVIARKKLLPVLERSVPLYGVQGFERFLTKRGRGRLLENSLGL